MKWYAIYRKIDGELYSIGTDVIILPDMPEARTINRTGK